jgi:hypothetical protein
MCGLANKGAGGGDNLTLFPDTTATRTGKQRGLTRAVQGLQLPLISLEEIEKRTWRQ